jgi:nucleoside-diphosphate-sugar epimerase
LSRLVLLTGATGFVGRQVLRALAGSGTRVRAVVRVGSEERLERTAALERVVGSPDLFAEDRGWWSDVCAGVDTVVHAAWYAEPGLYLQSPKNLDCLVGTLRLAQGAAASGVRRWVGIGTCFEYDLAHGTLSVATPLRPASCYAGAKAAAFMALSQFLPEAQVEFAWCRLFYLYGEGEDARRLVPYVRMQLARNEPALLTRGDQVRDFLDVAEAGRMIARTALSQLQGPVNVCSGIPVTVRAFAERVAAGCGRLDLLRFGARPDNLVDPPCVVGMPGQETKEQNE